VDNATDLLSEIEQKNVELIKTMQEIIRNSN